MNQIFSFERYTQLLKHQLYKDATSNKIAIAVAVFVTAFMFWWSLAWEDLARTPIFVLIVLVSPALSLLFFEVLDRKNRRKMFYFSLPASALERVAVYFTFAMIIVPIFMLAIFTVSDFIALHLYNYINDASEVMFFKTIFSSQCSCSSSSSFSLSDFVLFFGFMSLSILMSLFILFGKEMQNILFFFVFPALLLLNHFVFQLSYSTIMNVLAMLLPIFWILMFFAIKKGV